MFRYADQRFRERHARGCCCPIHWLIAHGLKRPSIIYGDRNLLGFTRLRSNERP